MSEAIHWTEWSKKCKEAENKIVDLEKTIKLLGERCNQLLKDKGYLTDQIADIKANCNLAIEGRDVKITDLEKENAELKNVERMALYSKLSEQLTKAKEIIRQFLNDYPVITKELLDKLEQFLKGENIILEDAQVGNSPFDADEVFNKEMKAYPEEK